MSDRDIKVEVDNGVAWILFNRPAVNNAVRGETMRQLCEELDNCIGDADVKAIVLGSVGNHFVAGAEFSFLEQLAAMNTTQVQNEVYTVFQGAARRLYGCPKPTVAAISGAAITVGCELAIACDFRIVTPKALFQESWIKLGLIPPLGGMKLLPPLVGLSKATAMILRGVPVRGEEAFKIGLANELVEPKDLRDAAQQYALFLAETAPDAYRAAKAGLHRALESTMEHEWQANALAQSILIGTADFREGLDVVKSKRTPRFGGR